MSAEQAGVDDRVKVTLDRPASARSALSRIWHRLGKSSHRFQKRLRIAPWDQPTNLAIAKGFALPADVAWQA